MSAIIGLDRLPEGTRFEYRFSLRNGNERHDWNLIGKRGAVGIWAEPSSPGYGDRWYGGIELHHAEQPDYLSEQAKHDFCFLLLKPCWHDGSSLCFSEQVEPHLPDPASEPMRPHVANITLPRLIEWWRAHIEQPEVSA